MVTHYTIFYMEAPMVTEVNVQMTQKGPGALLCHANLEKKKDFNTTALFYGIEIVLYLLRMTKILICAFGGLKDRVWTVGGRDLASRPLIRK